MALSTIECNLLHLVIKVMSLTTGPNAIAPSQMSDIERHVLSAGDHAKWIRWYSMTQVEWTDTGVDAYRDNVDKAAFPGQRTARDLSRK